MSAQLSSASVAVTTGKVEVARYTARDGGERPIELAYDMFGTRGRPLVLVMGIGAQRIFWDDAMCEQFVGAGFQVVRFDHRDIGHSTHLDAAVPRPLRSLVRGSLKLPVAAPYSLSDMAQDVVGLMDGLRIDRAHVFGASMGGMIGQHLAIEHGARLRSLTTIMTSPGGRRYMPEPAAFRALFAPRPLDREQAGLHAERTFRAIGSPDFAEVDAARLRRMGAEAFSRGMNPLGFLRQFAAVLKSGDRRPHLPRVTVPTLVIHGSRDPMFPLGAGRRLAELVPNATWLPITGMGHDMPERHWPTFVAAIARHAERADERGTV